eukprot:8127827-Alexandrium_andersonii.AAC.1
MRSKGAGGAAPPAGSPLERFPRQARCNCVAVFRGTLAQLCPREEKPKKPWFAEGSRAMCTESRAAKSSSPAAPGSGSAR